MGTLSKGRGSERSVKYDGLRRSYDVAFREWVVQRNRLALFATSDQDYGRILESSSSALRDRRDTLVDFLMSNSPSPLTMESCVREAAYFIWLNAGRPAETAISDWTAAGRQLALP